MTILLYNMIGDSDASEDSSHSRIVTLESVMSDSKASEDPSDSRTDMLESVMKDSQVSKNSSDSSIHMLESVMSDSQASKESNQETINTELPIYIDEKLLHIFIPEQYCINYSVFTDKVYRIDDSVFVEYPEVKEETYVQFELYAKKLKTEFEDDESTEQQSSIQTNEDDVTDESLSEDMKDNNKIFIDFENHQYEKTMKKNASGKESSSRSYTTLTKKPKIADSPENVTMDLNKECNVTDVDKSDENEMTYAMMTKKPKAADPPEHVTVVLNNEKYNVKYDIYHMLLFIRTNQLYCMLCKETFFIYMKYSHCDKITHLMRLSEAHVVESYKGYFIRIVDDKYYHCAHCNNLQPEFNLIWHLQTEHPKPLTANRTITPEENSTVLKDTPTDKPKVEPAPETTNVGTVNTLADFPINHYVFYHVFNYYRRMPFMGYHGILAQKDKFFCGLCRNYFLPQYVSIHVNSQNHVWNLSQNPFLLQYSFHLIRQIKFDLHCALCNLFVTIEKIVFHINSPYHLALLQTSYALTSPGLPLNVSQAVFQVVQSVPTTTQTSPKVAQVSPKVAEITPKVTQMTQTSPKREHVTKVSSKEAQTSPKSMQTLPKMTQTSPKRAHKTNESSKEAQNSPKETQTSPKRANVAEISPTVAETSPKETQTSPKVAHVTPYNAQIPPEANTDEFDTEEYVYVFLENTYYKILKTSYNSFVCVGDGTRYCFVCSIIIFKESLGSHVSALEHENNLNKYKYLKGKVEHMLRQNNQLYHCSICNVLFDGKYLDSHLQWVRHLDLKEGTRNISKKTRQREVTNGTKIVKMETQKEKSYKHEDQKMTIAVYCDEESKTSVEFVEECEKVIYRRRNETLEVDFYAWHSLKMKFNLYQCQLCQVDMKMEEIDHHIALSSHLYLVSVLVERQYRVFMRKVKDRIHCLICNTMLPSTTPDLQSHSNSEAHNINYDFIVTVNKTY